VTSSRKSFLLSVLFLVSASLTGACGRVVNAAEMLEFFRVVEDKSIYDKQPQRFDVLVSKSKAGQHETYVERKPSLAIDNAEIKSISIEKAKVRGAEKGIYTASISVSEKAGRTFIEIVKKHEQELFDVRFGKSRLAIVQFIGPFEPRADRTYEFTVYLEEDLNRIKKIFEPIKNKVTWE